MTRYNWLMFRDQFITDDFATISDFFKQNNIKDNSRNRLHTKGWLVEKKEYQEEIIKRTKDKIIEDEIDIRLRQQELAKQLQIKGLIGLKELPIEDVEDARKLVVSGMEQEREALGMKGKSESNLTQVNVNLPKTRFDELIEGQDLEGLFKLIAEVKKEKIRRSVKQVEN